MAEYGRSSVTTSLTSRKYLLHCIAAISPVKLVLLNSSPKISFLLTGVHTTARLYHRLVTFTMTTPSSGIPGLVVPEGHITAEDIPNVENIGGKPHESHDIQGVPITPEIAAEIRSAEVKAGHDTGKGSAAARVQSAAAFNLRENIVPPVGTKVIGVERGNLDGKAQ